MNILEKGKVKPKPSSGSNRVFNTPPGMWVCSQINGNCFIHQVVSYEYAPMHVWMLVVGSSSVGQSACMWMQVLKIPGLNPAAVHGLLGLCATYVLRPANN